MDLGMHVERDEAGYYWIINEYGTDEHGPYFTIEEESLDRFTTESEAKARGWAELSAFEAWALSLA